MLRLSDNNSQQNNQQVNRYAESIIDKKKFGDVWKYKVKWKGLGENECTWEPLQNLDYKIVNDFEKKRGSVKNYAEGDRNPFERRGRPRKNPLKISEQNKLETIIRKMDPNIKSEENSGHLNKKREREKEKEKESTSVTDIIVADQRPRGTSSVERKSDKGEKNDILLVMSKPEVNYELDVPDKILNGQRDEKQGILFLVKWKTRSDGFRPKKSHVNNIVMKKLWPQRLLDFYESRILFPKEEDEM